MLFYEWKTLYGQVADLSESQVSSILKTIGYDCSVSEQDRLSAILFVIHTYNSIIIKILAAEIVSKIKSISTYSDFAQNTIAFDDDEMISVFETELEKSEFYERANIKGFIEEPLFSWYIDAYKQQNITNRKLFADSFREILIRLSCYQIGNLSHARTNDVLKLFYQNLIPETMRKSLGEFYTPDWLVEVVLDKVSGDFYSARFLDPTCGSGSFLLNVINRIRKSGEIQGRKDILDIILNNVWGFDLNPLAVQTARLNYLISIADLIVENPGIEIEIPVLLADAIYSPAPNPDADQDLVTYLCSLLNNSIVQRYLMSYLITLQVGDVLHNLKLPDYDENNELHNHLAIYTKRAHEIKECAERDAIMQEIDHIGEKILFC